jgi:enamine deaminase RidA (YjgF/YER057c/UK114 family)
MPRAPDAVQHREGRFPLSAFTVSGQSRCVMPGRRHILSGSPYESTIGFSRAVRVGDRVLVSGTAPIWPDGSCDPDPAVQTRRCLEIIVEALRQAGGRAEDVVRTRMYLTNAADADAVGRVHGEVFRGISPAATMVMVAGLLDPRWKVEIEAEAIVSADADG